MVRARARRAIGAHSHGDDARWPHRLGAFGAATSGETRERDDAAEAVRSYAAGPSIKELVVEIEGLLVEQRRLERLICRYLADRIGTGECVPAWGGYADVYDAAEHLFGMGIRKTRERVRIGRALPELPRIERAFDRGDIGYARVREITRVATPPTELGWLEAAQRLPARQMEERVIRAGGRSSRCSSDRAGTVGVGEQPSSSTSDTVRLELFLPTEALARLRKAMAAARQRADRPLTDVEALDAIVSDVLAMHDGGVCGVARREHRSDAVDVPLSVGVEAANADRGARGGGVPEEMGLRAATPLGSPVGALDASSSHRSPEVAVMHRDAARVLAAMGPRGGWRVDGVCESTGLHIGAVKAALLLLELDGFVQRRANGYQPL